MTHSPELTAAAYLAGELPEQERVDFEEHLLECDDCWSEVDAGRRGSAAIESLRELPPPHLRAEIRRRLSAPAERSRLPRPFAYAAACVVLVLGVGAAAIVARQSPPEPIAAAVAGYAEDELPGSGMPKGPAPDLSELRLTGVGAGAGRVGDMDVSAYAYRDDTGRRLMVLVGSSAFPMPSGAKMFHGKAGPWMAHREGIAVLCARQPHRLLILGDDDELVHDAAVALDVM
ncbi:MAG: zf-HC2 domain-containing protein [Chloroflexi bacterium]|nr:zf-HC2 domain-containing protein [Chloroflexota bacterium]